MIRFRSLLLCLGLLLALAAPATAAALKETPLPPELSAGIDYLLGQVGASGSAGFDPERIDPLLNFVLSAKDTGSLYVPEKRDGATAAYYEFDLKGDLQRLLRYTANPQIPAHLFMPSSVRQARWLGTSGGGSAMPPLAELLTQVQQGPRVVRGREREEITPNLSTGTYFLYDLDRTLILLQHRGQPLFISLSRQQKTSEVGKKGVVLGNDGRWDYLYTGQKGMAKSGLGWASTYMYQSFSINIYAQVGERGLVRCGVFKWLDAGWVGMNFVSSRHIYDGLARFGQDLKGVLEHPRLPAAEELALRYQRLARLAPAQVDGLLHSYLTNLEAEYGRGGRHPDPNFVELVRGEAYLQAMNREQKAALLDLELFKCLLGKACVESLLPAAR